MRQHHIYNTVGTGIGRCCYILQTMWTLEWDGQATSDGDRRVAHRLLTDDVERQAALAVGHYVERGEAELAGTYHDDARQTVWVHLSPGKCRVTGSLHGAPEAAAVCRRAPQLARVVVQRFFEDNDVGAAA